MFKAVDIDLGTVNGAQLKFLDLSQWEGGGGWQSTLAHFTTEAKLKTNLQKRRLNWLAREPSQFPTRRGHATYTCFAFLAKPSPTRTDPSLFFL